MIDALLYAVRDTIRAAQIGYGYAECEIMEDGKPPPRCGNFFVSIHGGRSRPGQANDNNLFELFDYSVTLTMRVSVPLDRVGDRQIALNVNLVPEGQRRGFDHKIEQLRALLHMNWRMVVMQGQNPNSANDNLTSWSPGPSPVYGFSEPARYVGPELPKMVGGEWFNAEPTDGDEQFGIVSEMKFQGAKRFQPLTMPSGSFT